MYVYDRKAYKERKKTAVGTAVFLFYADMRFFIISTAV